MADDDEDAGLMVAAGKGDKGAFTKVFDRHQGAVVRFCYRFVGSQARAEELAQDIFIKLYRTAKGYRPEAKFTTYLFRIATNTCLNDVRRKGVEQLEGHVSADEGKQSVFEKEASGDMPDAHVEGREVESAVQRAIGGMSERERAAFCMCRFEGMAYRDIAAALEASEAAVKSLIHRATLQVAKQLEDLKAGLGVPRRMHA